MKASRISTIFFAKKRFYFILCNLFVLCSTVAAQAGCEWTALVYVQAKNNLSPFALKNFSDMASIGSNDNVNLVVQWYQPGSHGVWRYKIEKGKMVLDECNAIDSDGNTPRDLTDSMRWAVTKYPAQKYSLILWNHGIGIIDPLWGRSASSSWRTDEQFVLNDLLVRQNPRFQIEGVTTDHVTTLVQNEEEKIMQEIAETLLATTPRGILFNEHSKTYMNNQSLAQALHDIKTNILGGKKIDLLGMDACLMAMVEVGYLARNYAHVFVGSQEVELAHGWNYAALAQLFSTKNSSSDQVARGIISSYEAYYKDKIHFHTQSAIKLDTMTMLKDSIDRFVNAYRACKKNNAGVVDMIKRARRACLQFSAANYIDLHTFYIECSNQINSQGNTAAFNDLKVALQSGMRAIEGAVIANTAGKNLVRAKGLSIYFPQGYIDASYPRTEFARDCQWYSFIQELQR